MAVSYRPVKLLDREMIGTFRCLPVIKSADETIIYGKSALRHDRDVMVTAKANATLIKRAFADLSRAFDKGDHIRMIVPINSYAVATREASTLIVGLFKALDPSIRQAVILDVFDFPNPLTQDILDNISILLIPFFDKLMAEPAPDMDDFSIFANLNYFGVSIDLEARGLKGEEAIKVMTKFWSETAIRRLKCAIQGVTEAGMQEKANRYEVFMQDGSLIGSDVSEPVSYMPEQPISAL